MNGREIEHVLGLIDENVEENGKRVRAEMFRFIADHEDDVLSQLRATESARIPTSWGMMTVHLADLRQLAA